MASHLWGRQLSSQLSLTPFTKKISPKRSVLAVCRFLCINGNLNTRKTCGRKKSAQAKGLTTASGQLIKQGLFKNLGKAHKEWTAAGISASRATRCNHDMSYNFNKKQLDCCSVDHSLLFRWKSVSHFICKENSQSLEEEWKGSKCELPEVQCDIFTVSDEPKSHVICLTKFNVNTVVTGTFFFAALPPFPCWQVLWRC